MEAITKYRSIDGSEWNTADKAIERDRLCEKVNAAMRPLQKFTVEHHNFVQHKPDVVTKARVAIVRLAAIELPDFKIFAHVPPAEVHPLSLAGRILDDVGGPLRTAWFRFMCIDDLGREWEQSYYVKHPPEDATCIATVGGK